VANNSETIAIAERKIHAIERSDHHCFVVRCQLASQ
jgi:hypothetical protein